MTVIFPVNNVVSAPATTYTLSADQKTITGNDGKTYTFDSSNPCAYNVQGKAISCKTKTLDARYKGPTGPWYNPSIWWIEAPMGVQPGNTLKSDSNTIDVQVVHKYLFLTVERVERSTASMLIPKSAYTPKSTTGITYTWKAAPNNETASTITDSDGMVYSAEKLNGAYIFSSFKSATGWRISGTNSGGTYYWSLIDPTGKDLGSIAVNNPPEPGKGNASGQGKVNQIIDKGLADMSGSNCGAWWPGVLPSMSNAICNMTLILTGGLQDWIAKMVQNINFMLDMPMRMMDTNLANGGTNALQDAWKNILNVTLSLLTLALLIIAFANIINVDEKLGYGLNRMIPKIIISIVMAYFSYIITRFLFDLTASFQTGLAALAKSGGGISSGIDTVLKSNAQASINTTTAMNGIFMMLFMLILFVLLFLVTLWLAFLTTARVAVLWILIALAPMAMLMNILPFTESFYKRWWGEWWKWLFMGPAIAVMLYLSSAVLDSFTVAFTGSQGFEAWMLLFIATVCIFMAGTIPLTMGGALMKQMQGVAKGTGNLLRKRSGLTDAMATRKSKVDERSKTKGATMHAKVAALGTGKGAGAWAARAVAGVDKDQAKSSQNTVVNDRMKQIEEMNLTKAETQARYMDADGTERLALARFLSSKGWHDDGSENYLNRLKDDLNDPIVAATTGKEQGDVYSAMSMAGIHETPPGPDGKSRVNFDAEAAKATGKAMGQLENLTHQQVTLLSKSAEGQAQLISLLGNKQKVNALNEKGRERTVAALGEFIKQMPAQERMKNFGHIDRDHENGLRTVVSTSTTYEAKIDPKTQGPSNPWHEVK